MSSSTLDGSTTPFIIPSGSIEQANDGDSLFLLGIIDNQGTIFTNGTGTASAANVVSIVLASPAVTLEGGGTLLLSGASDSQLYGSTASLQSLVNVDNTITGSGDIGESSAFTIDAGTTAYPIGFTNEAGGVINANGSVVPTGFPPPGIFISTGTAPLVNDGLMEATGIDDLILDSATIDQSGGGTLLASGAGVTVGSLYFGASGGVDIIGGTLAVSDGGQLGIGNATLDGSVTPLTIGAGIDFSLDISALLGTIDNLGTIDMTGAGFDGGNIFLASGTVTLAGTGDVLDPTLSGAGGDPVTLVNVANTIAGAGTIGIAVIETSSFGPLGSSAPVALTNEAGGVIDASDTASPLTLFGGGAAMRNDGLMEATGAGGLIVEDATLDQSGGGTLLAGGAGVTVDLMTVDLIGGAVQSSGGGLIYFSAGSNTLTSGPGPLVIGAGGVVGVRGGTLTLQAATIDNRGTLPDSGTIILAGPSTTLSGGGLVQLAGVVTTAGTVTLINTNNMINGGSIGGAALAMTNAAGGVISGTELDIGDTLTNAGLLQDVSFGAAIPTTIDNTGAGKLLATAGVTLYDGDIVGGTLAASGGGEFFIGGVSYIDTVTLDGRAAPVTIEAGTTVQDFFNEISLPFTFEASGNLTLLGTIELAGTIVGANPQDIESGGFAIPNAGLLVGAGAIDGYVANSGTLLAQGGTMTVSHDVSGSGGIAISPGAAFVLGGASGETVDFEDAPNDRLVLNTPTAFTGTLANMTFGDVLDLGSLEIQSATVVGGDTLAVALAGNSTIDYGLANLHAGTSFVPRASPTPTETFTFTYVGGATTNEPDYSATGTGSLTVLLTGGTASLADVVAFNAELFVTTTGTAFPGPGTDPITYDLASLTSFAATFGSGDTLATLTLGTGRGGDLSTGIGHVDGGDFEVTGLGAGEASTDDQTEGGALTVGSIDVTPLGAALSELVVACFAAGTRILAAGGERRVEDLRVGDMVPTAAGGLRRIVWAGHRHVECRRYPRPDAVQPVRVRAHAFGRDVPHADLLLSPDHAVLAGGVLIPVRYLVNGATVVREQVDEITYWHVELDAHDAVLAENLPCESYLDTGNRGAFTGRDRVTPAAAAAARRADRPRR